MPEKQPLHNVPAARNLRQRTTQSEDLLWERLRNRQLRGLKFRRQHPVGPYVLDFYCPELRLAIEIDGSIHLAAAERERDHFRQVALEELGVQFLRISAAAAEHDIETVLHRLETIINKTPPRPARERGPGGEGMTAVTLARAEGSGHSGLGTRMTAIVVGSGPNGLAAAITLARAGLSVRVFEASDIVGGGLRSEELTLPGFTHDPCASVFPMGIASPIFRSLPLRELGVEWVHGELPLVHLRDGTEAIPVHHSLAQTVAELGPAGDAYRRLIEPSAGDWPLLIDAFLGPPFRVPRHPFAMARFARYALRSSDAVVRRFGGDERLRALWGGVAAHLAVPLNTPMSASTALLLLAAAHSTGWPIARGGSGALSRALADHLRSLGGEIELGRRVRSLDDLPPARVILFDTSPEQLLAIAGDRLRGRYRRQLSRFRRGNALFKLDYALAGPVPWHDPRAALAPTVHLGTSYASMAEGELAVARGALPAEPFVIAVQPTLFDPTRAPAGKHVLWAYCHVPYGSTADMRSVIESRIERAAPGFRDLILACHARGPADLERENANFAGGDFSNGAMSGLQTLFRPALRFDPYATPDPTLFLCSAATPPGPGVHGMCGYWAARSALRSLGIKPAPLGDVGV